MEETLIGGAPRESVPPGNLREPGLWEAAVKTVLSNADYSSGEREFETLRFISDKKKRMPIEERDVCEIIEEVEATSWHLRECICMRELAATHRLERT